jgi:hypothetical protein
MRCNRCAAARARRRAHWTASGRAGRWQRAAAAAPTTTTPAAAPPAAWSSSPAAPRLVAASAASPSAARNSAAQLAGRRRWLAVSLPWALRRLVLQRVKAAAVVSGAQLGGASQRRSDQSVTVPADGRRSRLRLSSGGQHGVQAVLISCLEAADHVVITHTVITQTPACSLASDSVVRHREHTYS